MFAVDGVKEGLGVEVASKGVSNLESDLVAKENVLSS
jgi:hypothetical protein